jgi:hypothetical protein
VDPAHRQKCGMTKKRADSTSVETALGAFSVRPCSARRKNHGPRRKVRPMARARKGQWRISQAAVSTPGSCIGRSRIHKDRSPDHWILGQHSAVDISPDDKTGRFRRRPPRPGEPAGGPRIVSRVCRLMRHVGRRMRRLRASSFPLTMRAHHLRRAAGRTHSEVNGGTTVDPSMDLQ